MLSCKRDTTPAFSKAKRRQIRDIKHWIASPRGYLIVRSITTSIMSNSTGSNANSTGLNLNSNSTENWNEKIDALLHVAIFSSAVVNIVQAVLIFVPNALLLVTILSSPTLKSRMRNKLILSLCLTNLIVAVIHCSITASWHWRTYWVLGCKFKIFLTFLNTYIQNCVSSWGMVALLGHYLCQLTNHPGPEFYNKVPVWVRRVGPPLYVVFPWVLAFVGALPVTVVGLDRDLLGTMDNFCTVRTHKWAAYTEATLNFFVPSFVSIVLVVVILIVYKCGRVGRHSDEREHRKVEVGSCLMNAETLEKPAVHVAAGLVTVVFMAPEYIVLIWFKNLYRFFKFEKFILVDVVTSLIEELFPIIVGIIWLLFLADIRARFLELLKMVPYKFCSSRIPPDSSLSSFPRVVLSDIADE